MNGLLLGLNDRERERVFALPVREYVPKQQCAACLRVKPVSPVDSQKSHVLLFDGLVNRVIKGIDASIFPLLPLCRCCLLFADCRVPVFLNESEIWILGLYYLSVKIRQCPNFHIYTPMPL